MQVIGQQWQLTYRYPQYGGVETSRWRSRSAGRSSSTSRRSTSIHSFWAYQLGVKADAVPGADNIAFVTHAKQPATFTIRCAELCGLWHGYMARHGRVVDAPRSRAWIASSEKAATLRDAECLPPYRATYYPDPLRRAG